MLAEAINENACPRCNGKARVWSNSLKRRIRCPACTRPRPSRDAIQMLTAMGRERAAELEQQAIDRLPTKAMTGHACAVALLYEWGRWVRDRGIGYPHMAATEKARIGRGGGGQDLNTPFPPDLQAIDFAVTSAPTDYKTILVEHYTKNGFITEKAARLTISRQTYYVRRAAAERYIANEIGV